jgi:hypothetical protein
VGEASIVLDEKMLVPYEGVQDVDYPRKLQERIEKIMGNPEELSSSARNVTLAREKFDYAILAERVGRVIDAIVR